MDEDRRAYYEYTLLPARALGRPASIAFTDGTQDRRRARPQRPAAVALRGDEGRLPGDGLGGRRARHRRRRTSCARAACSRGGSSSSTSSRAASSRTRRSRRSWSRASPYRELGRDATASRSADLSRAERRSPAEPRDALPAPAGLRLHERGSAHPDRADGPRRQGSHRVDGRGRGAGVPVRSPAAALPLLQAALRAGDEPGDRLDPRAAGDVALLHARRGGQPAGRDAGARAPAAPRSARDHRRRAGADPRTSRLPGFQARDALDGVQGGGRRRRACDAALERLCRAGLRRRSAAGANLLVLSDRDVSTRICAPIPALLATGAVHHHLIREDTRTRCGIVVETGEAREVAHFALLIGYGAGAINPYLAFETIAQLVEEGTFVPEDLGFDKAVKNYLKATDKGLLKIFAKMGISTLRSYRGAQIFEAVGLDRDLVDRYFTGTASRISGVGEDVIARETADAPRARLRAGCLRLPGARSGRPLPVAPPRRAPHVQSRHGREAAARGAQRELRAPSRSTAQAANDDAERLCTLRGLLKFKSPRRAGAARRGRVRCEAIMRRFCTGAMSYGSISLDAHQTLAIAMNRIGGKSNTGEGGEDSAPLHPAAERRLAAQRDQAGGVGALRRDQLVPRQRGRAADQDRAGREAGRGRPAARPQGRRDDRARRGTRRRASA